MNRILMEADEIGADGLVTLDGRRAAHLEQVLGCRAGDTVRIGMIGGSRGTGEVLAIGGGKAQLRCVLDTPPMPPTGISLLLALPRPKVMHRLWAPLASLGVERLVLINAAKVERDYFDTHWLEPDAYRPLLVEGLEQSGDTRLPTVRVCRRFKPFIEDESRLFFGAAQRVVCHPYGAPPLAAQLPAGDGAAVVIAVGPEGGWTGYEIALLQRHGFDCVSFGERTLRTDTAVTAIVGAAMAMRAAPRVG